MPRKQKNKPQEETLNSRYKFHPYSDTQNNNNPKLHDNFIRRLRLDFRNLEKENLLLKDELKLKIKLVEEQIEENNC